MPIKFDKTPGRVSQAPPMLGQHTEELLTELGYGPEEMANLVRGHAVGTTANLRRSKS